MRQSGIASGPISDELVAPAAAAELVLGRYRFDVTKRALVMGILNRTPDSFFDHGAYFALDDLLRRAEGLVAAGADLLDVGGVKAGSGPVVTLDEELERVVPTVEALAQRFDVPISVDTWNATVAEASYAAGAVLGNDISGFGDPRYLAVAAAAGAGVVATHIRLKPRVDDPNPTYPHDDVVGAVEDFLARALDQAVATGVRRASVILDAGLDLGKTTPQSLELLRASDRLARLGAPLLLSASNKDFLGRMFDLPVTERNEASLAAVALGVSLGCRIVRVHDVAGSRAVCATIAAILDQ
ncbi:MAG: dihydropteroate synthase [Actinomycetota bacterium]|nr:dihydropteroate synthase [Actinomycetota bacterium]